ISVARLTFLSLSRDILITDNGSTLLRDLLIKQTEFQNKYSECLQSAHDMENSCETNVFDLGDIVQVVDITNLQKNFYVEDEMNNLDMTSLGTFVLLEKSTRTRISTKEKKIDDDSCVQRISLAYERLHTIPKIIMEGITRYVKILDISHNEFENLEFLKDFHQLTSLICDHNKITSTVTIPFLPTLELLWMNYCKIEELYPWARKLKYSCPNLKYLSLMKNPLILHYSNNGFNQEQLDYRLYMISLFPHLIHLDDKVVTANERKEAIRLYNKPLLDRVVTKTQENLPDYLRIASQKVAMMLSSSPAFSMSDTKSVVI
ncbi:unnamed protein product, partial [Phaedon cochleariae]